MKSASPKRFFRVFRVFVKIRHLRGFSVFPWVFTEYIQVEVMERDTDTRTDYALGKLDADLPRQGKMARKTTQFSPFFVEIMEAMAN